MTSNRAAGEVRAVKVRPVRLDGLSELWNGLGPERNPRKTGSQSLCKRPVIRLDLLYILRASPPAAGPLLQAAGCWVDWIGWID